MIKKILILTLFLLTSHLSAKEILTIGTYDSFSSEWGPGPEIENRFEEICDHRLHYMSLWGSSWWWNVSEAWAS